MKTRLKDCIIKNELNWVRSDILFGEADDVVIDENGGSDVTSMKAAVLVLPADDAKERKANMRKVSNTAEILSFMTGFDVKSYKARGPYAGDSGVQCEFVTVGFMHDGHMYILTKIQQVKQMLH